MPEPTCDPFVHTFVGAGEDDELTEESRCVCGTYTLEEMCRIGAEVAFLEALWAAS